MNIDKSKRLTFRLMDENDAQLLFELDQDVNVMRYINGGKMSSMDDIHNRFIPRLNAYRNPQKGWGLWQVNITTTNQFIGWVLVRPMFFFNGNLDIDNPDRDNLEIGWRFKQLSWGKGYATEAAQSIKQQLTDYTNVKKFSAIADPENFGSINIMKKIGMVYHSTMLHKDPQGDSEVVYYQCIT